MQLEVVKNYYGEMLKSSKDPGRARAESTVHFLKRHIERLDELIWRRNVATSSSRNCVINLSVDKPAEFRGAHRLLKPGGELYFSDIIATAAFPMMSGPIQYSTGSVSEARFIGMTFSRSPSRHSSILASSTAGRSPSPTRP